MKIAFSIISILTFLNVYSQDSLKIKQIDILVANINTSSLTVQKDTIKQDYPAGGLKMTTYLTMVTDGPALIKYVNNVNATMTENGVARQIITSNTFYFDHNKLIKVEESLIENEKKEADLHWYYSEDKPLYHKVQSDYKVPSDKEKVRAAFLLELSKALLKQFIK